MIPNVPLASAEDHGRRGDDDDRPVLTLVSLQGANVYSSSTITVELRLVDEDSRIDPDTLAITLDGISIRDSFSALPKLEHKATLTGTFDAAHGAHTLLGQAKDLRGRLGQRAFNFIVDQAPVAVAGPAQTVTLPAAATLDGSASSDPDNDPLTYRWTLTQKPAGSTATLAGADTPHPVLHPDLAGTYAAQLIVNDGWLDSPASSVAITVLPASVNQPPVVDAGPSQIINLPSPAYLAGSATDDGLPEGSTLTVTWSKLSGPGPVAFTNPSVAATTATFVSTGTYVLELSASDTQYTSTATVIINVLPPRMPPVVSAGPDQTITLPASATLAGSVTFFGLPPGAHVSLGWSELSGPAPVTFADASLPVTTATFVSSGTYVLELSASDPLYTSSATVTITVKPPSGPQILSSPEQGTTT
jgi:hypothetical protein